MANPFPLPALYCGFYILLPCTCPQLFVRDDIWPEDTDYLPEPLFRKDCTLESKALVNRQVSDPYSNTDLMLELNIPSLVFREIALDFHTDLK